MKYVDARVVFKEIPDEITLAISISNCPFRCKGCHSAYLQQDIGTELNEKILRNLIEINDGITCVCFMGGDSDKTSLFNLASWVKTMFHLKTAWYSGSGEVNKKDFVFFDYIKYGPYIEELGGLDKLTTNQRLYHKVNNKIIDISNKFRINKF